MLTIDLTNGSLRSKLVCSLRSKNNYSWFFVSSFVFKSGFFCNSPQSISRLVTGSSNPTSQPQDRGAL